MVEQSTFDEFNNNLRGRLIRPGDKQYDKSRSVYNAMTDRKPKCTHNEVRYRSELGKIYEKLGEVEKVIQEGKKQLN